MPAIPSGTKFIGISPNVPTPENRSSLSNSYQETYTIDDIISATGTDDFYNLDGTMSSNRTVDLDGNFVTFTNGNFGIGTGSPQFKLDVVGSLGRVYNDLDTIGFTQTTLSGNSDGLTTSQVTAPNVGAIGVGVRGLNDTAYSNYGKIGDSFLYSSIVNNGINVVSAAGFGTDDYIRFYAGQTAASGNIPDVYIQGKGATRGYVGIGTDSPSEKLEIAGKVKAQTVQLTTGAGANKYLVSDASGNGSWVGLPTSEVIAASDETTALTTGTAKVTFRMPYAMNVTAVRASLSTAQTSGSILTVDINEGGNSILSTKLTIDNTEKTSTTATTPAVISDSVLADDAEITIDIDQVGDGTAKGLKVTLIGTRA